MSHRRRLLLLLAILLVLPGRPDAHAGKPAVAMRSWAQKLRPRATSRAAARPPRPPRAPLLRRLPRVTPRRGGTSPADVAARRAQAHQLLRAAGVAPERLAETIEHISLGMPSPASAANPDDLLDVQAGFVSSYNGSRRAPNWVAVKITRSDVVGRFSDRLRFRRNMKYREDQAASPRDFEGVFAAERLTRGHLVGSGDQTGDAESHKATYQLGNIVPQLYENNAGPWHDFETYLRGEARARKDVYVFAGGVYDQAPRTIGRNRVAVPKATWKVAVVVEPGQPIDSPSTRVMYLVVPNEAGKVQLNETFERYLTTGPEVERLTGLRFFTGEAEPVRERMLAATHRPQIPVHYFSRRKIAEIRKLGLPLPANVQMDPADRTVRERVSNSARATRRFFWPARPATGSSAPAPGP